MILPSIAGHTRGLWRIDRAKTEADVLTAYAEAAIAQLRRAKSGANGGPSDGTLLTTTRGSRARALARGEALLFRGALDTRLGATAREDLLRAVELLAKKRGDTNVRYSVVNEVAATLRQISVGLPSKTDALTRIAEIRAAAEEAADLRTRILAELEAEGRLLPEADAGKAVAELA